MCQQGLRTSAAICLLWMAGCGPAPKGDMTGTVSYKGKPICLGSVTVIGSDKIPVLGNIEPDGTYTVIGVASGNVKIAILSPEPPKETTATNDDASPSMARKQQGMRAATGGASALPPGAKKWFAIPDVLGDPDKSGLTATIKGGANSHNIEIP